MGQDPVEQPFPGARAVAKRGPQLRLPAADQIIADMALRLALVSIPARAISMALAATSSSSAFAPLAIFSTPFRYRSLVAKS